MLMTVSLRTIINEHNSVLTEKKALLDYIPAGPRDFPFTIHACYTEHNTFLILNFDNSIF